MDLRFSLAEWRKIQLNCMWTKKNIELNIWKVEKRKWFECIGPERRQIETKKKAKMGHYRVSVSFHRHCKYGRWFFRSIHALSRECNLTECRETRIERKSEKQKRAHNELEWACFLHWIMIEWKCVADSIIPQPQTIKRERQFLCATILCVFLSSAHCKATTSKLNGFLFLLFFYFCGCSLCWFIYRWCHNENNIVSERATARTAK